MSERAQALATLAAIASSPDAVAVSPAHLFASLDALALAYHACAPDSLNARQVALRSERATWAAILSHAEHRLHTLNRAAQDDGA